MLGISVRILSIITPKFLLTSAIQGVIEGVVSNEITKSIELPAGGGAGTGTLRTSLCRGLDRLAGVG